MSKEKYLGLPLAAVLAVSSIACGTDRQDMPIPINLTDCDPSGTGSASTILHDGEMVELEGIPLMAKAGKVRIPIEIIGVENTRSVARHKLRIYRNGREADVSVRGGKILIETSDKKITVQGKPILQNSLTNTKVSISVECEQ